MKKILSTVIISGFLLLFLGSISVSISSCSSAKEPIKLKCEYCNGEGTCIACHGTGVCQSCDGTGKCDYCQGTGNCPTCKGKGVIPAPCPKCHGVGFLPAKNPGEEPIPCKYCKTTGIDPRGRKMFCPECAMETELFKKKVKQGKIDKEKYKKLLKLGYPGYWEISKMLKGLKKSPGKCIECNGTGKCSSCNGTGKCSFCNGTGSCKYCKGHGFNISIKICPNCYDTVPYTATECPKCHTKLKYDGADKKWVYFANPEGKE